MKTLVSSWQVQTCSWLRSHINATSKPDFANPFCSLLQPAYNIYIYINIYTHNIYTHNIYIYIYIYTYIHTAYIWLYIYIWKYLCVFFWFILGIFYRNVFFRLANLLLLFIIQALSSVQLLPAGPGRWGPTLRRYALRRRHVLGQKKRWGMGEMFHLIGYYNLNIYIYTHIYI